jgi:hypothetical protein
VKSQRVFMSLLGGLGLALSLMGAPPARAAVQVNETIPVEPFFVFVDCANDGAGEFISLTGPLHTLITFTEDKNGGVHGTTHFQPQGVTGVGEVTGDVYHAVGLTRDSFNGKKGEEFTFVNVFYMIGPGPGNNLKVHSTSHVTINANGSVTADVFLESITCQ